MRDNATEIKKVLKEHQYSTNAREHCCSPSQSEAYGIFVSNTSAYAPHQHPIVCSSLREEHMTRVQSLTNPQ